MLISILTQAVKVMSSGLTKKNNFQIVTALYIRLLPKIKQVIVNIFNNEILIQGYMEKIHSAGDSVIVLHAFEIPSLPYSSGPCEYTQM